jgi:hypothetical protein
MYDGFYMCAVFVSTVCDRLSIIIYTSLIPLIPILGDENQHQFIFNLLNIKLFTLVQ